MISRVSTFIEVRMHSSTLQFAASRQQGKWFLALIGWVIVVCLMKNSGLMFSCAMQYDSSSTSVLIGDEVKIVKAEKGHDTSKCELSEKLIQFAQQQLETLVVVLFVGIFALVVWRCCAFASKRQWTEPIAQKYRVHLTLCVFRE
ncbi:conserved hypothetical protein [Vibrio jasicida]|uniref:Membrane protein, suppressor for copper-sensitivity A n=2 Tax=Vibrio jasicida TaxID=766224 RepID=A0AAU9QIU9_9VIBR|nr:conserved hypothetical protein [Vibrio jasicida]CAH1581887.1 conserved hypothetical protein [Vibrio jasicida]